MDKKVKIYSTITCPLCVLAEQFFKENNISYEKIDVGRNRKAFEHMLKISGQETVPVIEVDDIVTIGFNKSRLNALLNITKERRLI